MKSVQPMIGGITKTPNIFLALAYLQNNEPDKADAVFKKIMGTPQHPYKMKLDKDYY
jgi:hypothetical protein